ncbi:MAG: hypothetical protein IIB04_05330 [Acidobacteria bacterium]|nr:hypothetical protein [Acidobacteriota bacterium]
MTDVLDARIAGPDRIAVRVAEAIRAVLPSSVSVRAARTEATVVNLVVNEQHLTVRWVREGWLRAIQEVLDTETPLPDIVVSRRMGPASRDALSAAGVGWVDETGAAEVVVGPLIVSRSGSPEHKRTPRWTRSVLAVAEALLCGSKATVTSMGDATGLSTGTCTNALRLLSDLELLEASSPRGRGSARRVSDATDLLAAYVEEAQSLVRPVSLQVGVTWQDSVSGLAGIGKTWDVLGTDWVASAQVAAAVMAPLLTSVRMAIVYVDADTVPKLVAVAGQVGLRPIEGGRLTLIPFPTVTTQRLSSTVQSLRVAPWPRVFVDLHMSGVRGEEAAEHLREVFNG